MILDFLCFSLWKSTQLFFCVRFVVVIVVRLYGHCIAKFSGVANKNVWKKYHKSYFPHPHCLPLCISHHVLMSSDHLRVIWFLMETKSEQWLKNGQSTRFEHHKLGKLRRESTPILLVSMFVLADTLFKIYLKWDVYFDRDYILPSSWIAPMMKVLLDQQVIL